MVKGNRLCFPSGYSRQQVMRPQWAMDTASLRQGDPEWPMSHEGQWVLGRELHGGWENKTDSHAM